MSSDRRTAYDRILVRMEALIPTTHRAGLNDPAFREAVLATARALEIVENDFPASRLMRELPCTIDV